MAHSNEITEVLHKIEAKLYPNYPGKGEGVYAARTKAEAAYCSKNPGLSKGKSGLPWHRRGGARHWKENLIQQGLQIQSNKDGESNPIRIAKSI